jgi:hypothetical protein
MPLLTREVVPPYYAQVELSAPEAPDYPDWGTGEGVAVATPGCVAVATRPDHLGNVQVEAWLDAPPPGVHSPPIWAGEMHFQGGHAVMGTSIGSRLAEIPLNDHDYNVEVYALPAAGEAAEVVIFVLYPRRKSAVPPAASGAG